MCGDPGRSGLDRAQLPLLTRIPRAAVVPLVGAVLLCVPPLPPATAAEPPAPDDDPKAGTKGGEASAQSGTRGSASVEGRRYSARGNPKNRDKWIYRWAPEDNMWEVGAYGGVWFPSRYLELFESDPALPDQGFLRFARVAPDVGLRGGYYPLRFVGVEAEGGVMPTTLENGGASVLPWTVRGHVVGQLGLWSVTPFLLVGAGVLGVASDAQPNGVGNEQDVAIHFGGGVKVYVNRWIQLRLDVRDVVSNRRGVEEGLASSPEILLGLSVTLGRDKGRKARPGRGDRDGDRVPDDEDYCPDVFGVAPRGCPTVCVDDNDGDGLPNPEDECPDEPESRNGFQDRDGCPDEVPPELDELAGIMDGINFDTDKDTITAESIPILDRALGVLQKYPQIRVEISGHTDAQGGYRHNMDLSRRRADAVRAYMVDKGVDGARMTTRGAGPDEPIDTNETAAGRARNRRIEFRILEQ